MFPVYTESGGQRRLRRRGGRSPLGKPCKNALGNPRSRRIRGAAPLTQGMVGFVLHLSKRTVVAT